MSDKIINSFKNKNELHPDIWDVIDDNNIKIHNDIRKGILDIVKLFVEFFNIKNLIINDVVIVGSLVNYNWSNYSDLDIHIVIDKNKLSDDENIIEELIDAKIKQFDEKYDLKVKGFDIEVYIEGIDEVNISNGRYSVLYKKWINTPVQTEFKIDKDKIIKKVKFFKKQLNIIKSIKDLESKLNKIEKLKDKIKKYRKCGLDRSGENSTENLIFKYLRRSGYMEELYDINTETKNKLYSVYESIVYNN